MLKISVHKSGQIHQRLGPRQKQDMAPLMPLGSGPWTHAFELRFLLSDDALSPIGQRESLKNKTALLIHVPDEFVLYANLIIGPEGLPPDFPLPVEFGSAGKALWRSRLRDGRLAVLVARVLALDDDNRRQLKYLREELRAQVTVSRTPEQRYVELHHLHWSATGGNVIFVAPMSDEALRSEEEDLSYGTEPQTMRTFYYERVYGSADLIAPDGRRIAVIELNEAEKQIELMKGHPKLVDLGRVSMRIETDNLVRDSTFISSPRTLNYHFRLGGVSCGDRQCKFTRGLMALVFLPNCLKPRLHFRTKTLSHT
jgi:hypothetical protein